MGRVVVREKDKVGWNVKKKRKEKKVLGSGQREMGALLDEAVLLLLADKGLRMVMWIEWGWLREMDEEGTNES